MIHIKGRDIPNHMRVIFNGSDITCVSRCLDFWTHEPSSLLEQDPPRIKSMASMIMDTIAFCNVKQLIFITLN